MFKPRETISHEKHSYSEAMIRKVLEAMKEVPPSKDIAMSL